MALSCTHTVLKWFEASSWLQEIISLWLFELDHCCGRRKKQKCPHRRVEILSRGSPNARWCIMYGLDWLKFLMGAGRGVSKRRRLKEASLQKSASWAWDRGASSSQEQADAIKSKQFLTMPFHHHRHEVSTILSQICASFRKPAQPCLLLCQLSGRKSFIIWRCHSMQQRSIPRRKDRWREKGWWWRFAWGKCWIEQTR